jgi:hypothetical protein
VAAGALITETAMKAGVIVKFSQNVLIGVAAFLLDSMEGGLPAGASLVAQAQRRVDAAARVPAVRRRAGPRALAEVERARWPWPQAAQCNPRP